MLPRPQPSGIDLGVTYDPDLKIQSRWVTEESDFLALRDVWNALADATDPANVFLRHEWFDAAWQWARLTRELRIALICRDDSTLGIAPLMIDSRAGYLTFLTVPDTQSCGLLAGPTDREAVANALARVLMSTRHRWRLVSLRFLDRDAHATQTLAAALSRYGMPVDFRDAGANLYISLSGPWKDFYASRGRRLKKNNNLVTNRIERGHVARIVRIRGITNPPIDVGKAVRTAMMISANSWKADLGVSLDHPGPSAFIKRLTQHAVEKGWLSLWLLSLDDRFVAMEYQLQFGDNIHALRADFCRGMDAVSPGSYLNRAMLERLFDGGSNRYLMGPGKNAYKQRWSDTGIPLVELRAYSPTWRGKVASVVERRFKFWARKLQNVLKRIATTIRSSAGAGETE